MTERARPRRVVESMSPDKAAVALDELVIVPLEADDEDDDDSPPAT